MVILFVNSCEHKFGVFIINLINALLACSRSFGGLPSLGRFFVVPHFLDVMVLMGTFKVSFF